MAFRVIIAGVVLVLATSTTVVAKDEIEGFKLGVPAKEVTRILDARKYRCGIRRFPGLELGAGMGGNSAPQALSFGCKAGPNEDYILTFATYLPEKPLVLVQRTFPSSLAPRVMIDQLQTEYGLSEAKIGGYRDDIYSAEWSDGPRHIRLGVLHQRYELRLTSTELIQKDKDAGAARQGR